MKKVRPLNSFPGKYIFFFSGKNKTEEHIYMESYNVPEELKLSFKEDLRSNPKEEEDGVRETDGLDLRFICFLGRFKPKLRPRSSFSNIIFSENKNKTFLRAFFCTKVFWFSFEREREKR